MGANMESYRKRYLDSMSAEDARNKLIEDLLQQVDDMQKTMDRNPYALVLIDGDGMNFLDPLVSKGIVGGEEASKLLRTAVSNELRNEADFRLDDKVIIKLYANLQGLSRTYCDYSLLGRPQTFADFVLGFNKSHALCDFIDAGNHKDGADRKLQETLSLNVYNVHCKHIILGASTDNSYASFLGSSHDDDIAKRVRLLEGPPFAFEYKFILNRFKQTAFPHIFRTEKIGTTRAELMRKPPIASRAEQGGARSWEADERPRPPLRASNTTTVKINSPNTMEETNITTFKAPNCEESQGPRVPHKSWTGDTGWSSVPAPAESSPGRVSMPWQQSTTSSPPSKSETESALIDATYAQLAETPHSCDFGMIRRRAAEKLNASPDVFGTNKQDPRSAESNRPIKRAVEQWMEKTDSPPPGNATWLLQRS